MRTFFGIRAYPAGSDAVVFEAFRFSKTVFRTQLSNKGVVFGFGNEDELLDRAALFTAFYLVKRVHTTRTRVIVR